MESSGNEELVQRRAEKFTAVRKHYGLTQLDFGERLGMPQGHVSKYEKAKRIIGKNIEYKLLKEFNVNKDWWYKDEGSMLTPELAVSKVTDQQIAYYNDIDVTAGPAELFMDGDQLPTGYISIPNFEDCDKAFPLWGDSMAPLYYSGQIVLCKEYTAWRDYLPFGEVFLVITDSLRTIKYVKKASSDDKYLLVSENPHFEPFEIPKKAIHRMFIVKGAIKRNMI